MVGAVPVKALETSPHVVMAGSLVNNQEPIWLIQIFNLVIDQWVAYAMTTFLRVVGNGGLLGHQRQSQPHWEGPRVLDLWDQPVGL